MADPAHNVSCMRIVLRSSSLLFSLLGIAANAPLSRVRRLLRPGAAGDLGIGMSVPQLRAEFEGAMKFDENGGKAHVFLASPSQRRPDLSFDIAAGAVTAIRVYARSFKTAAGIGPGGSVEELSDRYNIRWTDDNVAEVDDLRMSFQVEEDRIVSVLIW